jgi:DNA/RNA endonuclease G (NUC1)
MLRLHWFPETEVLTMRRIQCVVVLAALYATGLSNLVSALPAADTIRDTLNPNIQYGVAGIKGRVLDKGYYVINYSDRWRIPYWSAYHLTAEDLKGTAKRKNSFRPDLVVRIRVPGPEPACQEPRTDFHLPPNRRRAGTGNRL